MPNRKFPNHHMSFTERQHENVKRLAVMEKYLEEGTLPPSLSSIFHQDQSFLNMGLLSIDESNRIDTPVELLQLMQGYGMYATATVLFTTAFSEWIGNRRLLDPLAGRGWLAKGLREQGVDVIATDDASWIKKRHTFLTEVEIMDALDAVKKYAEEVDVVLFSWAPSGKLLWKLVKAVHKHNPNATMVFLSEPEPDISGNDKFYKRTRLTIPDHFGGVHAAYETQGFLHDCPYIITIKPDYM